MQELSWYVRRLRSMGPSEIAWRVRGLLRDQLDLVRVPLGIVPKLPAQSTSSFEQFRPGFTCSPVTHQHWNDLASPNLVIWRQRLVEKADLVLENRLSYFDLDAVHHGDPFNWHRDHSAGIDSPIRLSVLTDYREFSTYGDCKLVWEPNRHHQLVVLARAYVATNDVRYAEKVAELLRSWIDANPFGYGMNWKSVLEHGVRLINWVWALDLIRGSEAIDDALWSDIQQSAYLAMWDAERKFSRGSSANNHLIGEAAGVFIAACYFNEFPNASKCRQTGQAVLEHEIIAQTYDDGCSREHAFGYQFFVIQFFMLCMQAGDRTGSPFSDAFKKRLQQIYRFMTEISADTGQPPDMGDRDDGYVLDLGELPRSTSQLLSVGGYEFQDQDLVTCDHSETAFWLYGYAEQDSPNSGRPRSSVLFGASGYSILRSNRLAVFFDCAELGYGPLAAHGHADCLSFSLSIGGHPVFVDPGTFDYFTHPEWRKHFRETCAHNTAVVDGVSQSQMLGPFMWGHRATETLVKWSDDATESTVCGKHDGFERLPNPVIHTRELRLDKIGDSLTVTDHFECSGSHVVDVYFHCDVACKLSDIDGQTIQISGPFGSLHLSSQDGAMRRIEPGDSPMPGWVSNGYHSKRRSTSVVIRLDLEGTTSNKCEFRLEP